ncbi:TPA: hypothetical protein ACQZEA_005094, partial [Escherichia coli]
FAYISVSCCTAGFPCNDDCMMNHLNSVICQPVSGGWLFLQGVPVILSSGWIPTEQKTVTNSSGKSA